MRNRMAAREQADQTETRDVLRYEWLGFPMFVFGTLIGMWANLC